MQEGVVLGHDVGLRHPGVCHDEHHHCLQHHFEGGAIHCTLWCLPGPRHQSHFAVVAETGRSPGGQP